MNTKGVTLIELIVVMVIIAIGAALMTPGIGRGISRYRWRSATRDIVSTLRTAQMRAISNNKAYQVVFTPGSGTYILESVDGTDVGATQTVPSGITFTTSFAANTALFNPNSTAASGSVTVTYSKGSNQITVSSATGRISSPP